MISGKSHCENNKEDNNWKKSVVLYIQDLVHMLIGIFLVFLLLFRVIVVSGDSMYSTFPICYLFVFWVGM